MADLKHTVAYFRDDFVPFNDAQVSIASAPVLYGLSVYTVIPVFKNKQGTLSLFRIRDHFDRLRNSAKIMAFDDFLENWDYETFEATIIELIKKNDPKVDSLVRISIFVDDILMGTRMHKLKHSVSAFIYPITEVIPISGSRVMVSSWRRNPDNALPARAKINGGYVNAALMKHEAITNGFDDAIALDDQGHVTESTVANIFIIRNNILLTPGTSTDILEGITRDSIVTFARHHGIEVQEKTIDRSELYLADEIFLCGSSMNIVPILSVDHRDIGNGKPGKVTTELQISYSKYTHQKTDPFTHWLTPVV